MMERLLPWLALMTGLVLAAGGVVGVVQNEPVWLKALFVLVALCGLFACVRGWGAASAKTGKR